jgi:TonB family protein
LARKAHARQRGLAHGAVAGDDAAMDMQMSIGFLDERMVDRAMKPYVPTMVDCFEHAGDARRYLSGRVVLRFVVEASGAVSDIHVIENELGNYPVERCLIDVGRRIEFPPPEGNRSTDFEYSLRFRSTGEMRVMDWNDNDAAIRVASASDFSACGELGPQSVEAIAYVEPEGTIGSVGFVSQGPINPVAAACAEEQLYKLRISDARPNVVLRTVFPLAVVAQRTSKADLSRRPSKRSRHR